MTTSNLNGKASFEYKPSRLSKFVNFETFYTVELIKFLFICWLLFCVFFGIAQFMFGLSFIFQGVSGLYNLLLYTLTAPATTAFNILIGRMIAEAAILPFKIYEVGFALLKKNSK